MHAPVASPLDGFARWAERGARSTSTSRPSRSLPKSSSGVRMESAIVVSSLGTVVSHYPQEHTMAFSFKVTVIINRFLLHHVRGHYPHKESGLSLGRKLGGAQGATPCKGRVADLATPQVPRMTLNARQAADLACAHLMLIACRSCSWPGKPNPRSQARTAAGAQSGPIRKHNSSLMRSLILTRSISAQGPGCSPFRAC